MSEKTRNQPHFVTDLVHQEVAAQTPIIPQRNETTESGRHRVLEIRARVGSHAEREFHAAQFPREA